MKKSWIRLIPLASGVVLIAQAAKADTPYHGGIETVVPFALSGNNLSYPLLLGFLTSLLIYGFSSLARAKNDKRKFLHILFTDFWFEGFITPGLGSILLIISYGIFWSCIYFLIWSFASGYINATAFSVFIIADIAFYVTARAAIESIISLAKTTESVNAILHCLDKKSRRRAGEDALLGPSYDSDNVRLFLDGEPEAWEDAKRNQ